jgi:polar amino acid transport system substrate-binding protein
MLAFQTLLFEKKIDVGYLTSKIFKLEDAPAAYDLMMEKSERFIGMLIEYDVSKALEPSRRKVTIASHGFRQVSKSVNIGFLGAGSYAQGHLLPNIPKEPSAVLKGVMTLSGTTARSVSERFNFEFCTTDESDLIGQEGINTIFIATRHDTHAEYVVKALKSRQNVFVEKPLCIFEHQLDEIFDSMENLATSQDSTGQPSGDVPDDPARLPILMVGFNRRFAPLTGVLKEKVCQGPMAMTYRVNAGSIPKESWIQDPEIGGGRIIGEVCHFVDYLTYLNGSLPVSVYASAMREPQNLNDVMNISLTYRNGSIGTISYFANGDTRLTKEKVEVFCNQCSAVLDDFRLLTIYHGGRKKIKKLLNQDKGQNSCVKSFINAVTSSAAPPIPLPEIYSTSLVTFKILESIKSGKTIAL